MDSMFRIIRSFDLSYAEICAINKLYYVSIYIHRVGCDAL